MKRFETCCQLLQACRYQTIEGMSARGHSLLGTLLLSFLDSNVKYNHPEAPYEWDGVAARIEWQKLVDKELDGILIDDAFWEHVQETAGSLAKFRPCHSPGMRAETVAHFEEASSRQREGAKSVLEFLERYQSAMQATV